MASDGEGSHLVELCDLELGAVAQQHAAQAGEQCDRGGRTRSPGRATDAVDRGGVVVVLQAEPQRTAPARLMDRSSSGSHESGPEVSVRCSREHTHPGGIEAGLIVDLRTTEPGLVGPGRSNLDRRAPVRVRCADSP